MIGSDSKNESAIEDKVQGKVEEETEEENESLPSAQSDTCRSLIETRRAHLKRFPSRTQRSLTGLLSSTEGRLPCPRSPLAQPPDSARCPHRSNPAEISYKYKKI